MTSYSTIYEHLGKQIVTFSIIFFWDSPTHFYLQKYVGHLLYAAFRTTLTANLNCDVYFLQYF